MCLCLHKYTEPKGKCLTMQKQADIWGKSSRHNSVTATNQKYHQKTQPIKIKKSLKQICLKASAPHQSNGNCS